ncbi:MAG: hypothetical protein ACOYIG_13965 [Acetivibrionales bacterium]|jgi:hypothetical protein
MEESKIPMRENGMVCTDSSIQVVRNEAQVLDIEQQGYYPAYDKERTGKFVEEIIAAAKDDRMNTKRAISADIAATARVQNQNERYMAACERELHRKDLPEERRKEILDRMETIAASSERASAESRQFQQDQLNHSHKMPWKLIGIGAVILFGGLGGAALLRAA